MDVGKPNNFPQLLALATAHPAKFLKTITPIGGPNYQIPQPLAWYLNRTEHTVPMNSEYEELKGWLMLP